MYFTETHQNNASADLMMLNEALCSGYQMTKFSSIVFCQKMFSFFLAAIVVFVSSVPNKCWRCSIFDWLTFTYSAPRKLPYSHFSFS